jgi:signal transduction histidine kinase
MFRVWLAPLGLILSMGLLLQALGMAYIHEVNQHLRFRLETMHREMAENFRLLVDSHLRVLETTARLSLTPKGPDRVLLRKSIDAVLANYNGFYAVNLIDASGVITEVHPLERNRAALGQNLFARPSIAKVLEQSQRTGTPTMSGRLMTFQGVEGFTLYVPLLHEGKIVGWLNAVIDLEDWLTQFFARSGPGAQHVRIRWSEPTPTEWTYGSPTAELAGEHRFQVLNQTLTLSIAHPELGFASPARMTLILTLVVFVIIAIMAVLFWRLQVGFSRERELNERLRLKNGLLSSLTHDMGTPITVINLALDRIPGLMAVPEPLWQRLRLATQSLRHMLESVRTMQSLEAQNVELRLTPTSLTSSVALALESLQEAIERKNLVVENSLPPAEFVILADPSILVNNILVNVLSNAIKFSNPGGRLRLSAEARDDKPRAIRLLVVDEGVGIPPEQLELLREPRGAISREGTAGEKGSGLGMLQVRTFMELHHGRLEIESREGGVGASGTEVRLWFLAAGERRA